MLFDNNRISARQMQALLILWIVSTSFITLPYMLENGILSIVIGAIIVLIEYIIIIICMDKIVKTALLYKWAYIVSAIIMVFYAGMNIKFVCSLINIYLLPNTHSWIIEVVTAFLCLYMAVLGIQTIGRSGEILFVISAINAVIAFGLCVFDVLGNVELSNLTFQNENLIKNSLKSSFMISPPWILFVLLPITDGENKTGKAIYSVIISVIVIIAFIALAMFKFGKADVVARTFPLINITDTVNLEFIFGDKQDVLMLRMWIFTVVAVIGLGIYAMGKAINKDKKRSMTFAAIAAFIIAVIPQNSSEAVALVYKAGEIGFILFALIIILSLFIEKEVMEHEKK